MQADLQTIINKFRGLVKDFETSDFETFTYNLSATFTLAESNITSITGVFKNGVELTSGEYSYDSTTNKITITPSSGDDLVQNDIIEVNYIFNKYSDEEVKKYIQSALVHISINSFADDDYELEEDGIYPTPSNKNNDLISLISSILAKPDYTQYKLPNLTVRYPRTMTNDERIEKIVVKFQMGLGIANIITYE